jgi:hypothetical protein
MIRQTFTVDHQGEINLRHEDNSLDILKLAGLRDDQASEVILKSRKANDLGWDKIHVECSEKK